MAKCAFLGVGVMGGPMAGWLAKAGHEVSVWNRTRAKAESWTAQHAGRIVSEPADAVQEAEFVFMCLGDDPDVEAVFAQMRGALKSGVVLVDHTTGSPALARRLHDQCVGLGVPFLDAPVSGGQAGAENGQLTIMVGGEAEILAKAQPVMDAYAKQMTLIGGPGAGQTAKCVNQIAIAGLLQGLAEGLHFAAQSGLDAERVISAISRGAAQSWQMENRWETMSEGAYDHGFAVDWMRKDLRIALEAAREMGMRLPVTALVDQFYADVQAMGGGRWDTSSLLARLEPPKTS